MAGKRLCHDWISAYEKYTENSESPRSYHIWAACSCLASALQRRVYLSWGYNTLYPNLYVVLVGPSGKVRKGDAINVAKSFIKRIGVPLLGDDNSLESIILDMKDAVTSFKDRSSNRITFHCSISSVTEELAVFTGEQNTRFLSYLTNWYDSRDEFKRRTKHQGKDEVTGVCLNILSATAPDWLPYILPRTAIGGGFTSRCIFVVEDYKAKIIANPNLHKPDTELARRLAIDLELIAAMSGEFKLDSGAVAEYVLWYETEEKKIAEGHPTITEPMLQGYNARRATHLLKLSMIMSASRGNDYIITAKDFRRARMLLEITEKKMPRVFTGIGKAKYAEETELILHYIANRRVASKSEVMRQFYKTIDDYSLDIIVKVLASMKVIRVIIGEKDTKYEYLGAPMDNEKDTLRTLQ